MGRKPHKQFKATIAVDVSGSISEKDIQDVLNELRWLFQDNLAEITYQTFDTAITETRRLRGHNDVREIKKVHGRGGTSFKAILEHAKKESTEELIVFTDGYGDQDELETPPHNLRVWWITTDRDDFPFGQVFKIDK